MSRRRHEPTASDTYRTRSRCDSCDDMVIEGKAHKCSGGNDQQTWTNPAAPKET